MTRVLLLTTNLAVGGAEIQVARLALALRSRGWEAHVASLLKPTALESELRTGGVPVYSLDAGVDLLTPVRLLSLLQRLKPQILHAHMFHANMAARLVRLFCPVPVVISTIHSLAESSRRSRHIWLRDRLYRATSSLTDRTVCVSSAAAERHIAAHAVNRARTLVIHNGVDTNRFRPDPCRRERTRAALGLGEEFAWLAAGRLMWKKNYPLTLRAAAQLPGCTLLVAGEGPDGPQLKALAAELGVRARFLGPRQDMPDLMNACDGLVLSSSVEGLPMVLLEAAASGLPQVATAVGGVPEAVVHERTGLLVPWKDPNVLAAAMARLAGMSPPERASMSSAAREHALAAFDMNATTAKWERLYEALLHEERLSSREP